MTERTIASLATRYSILIAITAMICGFTVWGVSGDIDLSIKYFIISAVWAVVGIFCNRLDKLS